MISLSAWPKRFLSLGVRLRTASAVGSIRLFSNHSSDFAKNATEKKGFPGSTFTFNVAEELRRSCLAGDDVFFLSFVGVEVNISFVLTVFEHLKKTKTNKENHFASRRVSRSMTDFSNVIT